MKLKYHDNTDIFFEKDGSLKEEPEESLQKLLKRYDKACDLYHKFREKMKKAQEPYTKVRWIKNVEPVFIESANQNYDNCIADNIEWSDITLVFATDLTTFSETITRQSVGNKGIFVTLPQDIHRYHTCECPLGYFKNIGDSISNRIKNNPHYCATGIRLNVAGDNALTLKSSILADMEDVSYYVVNAVRYIRKSGISISEIRSGGQPGIEEFGIHAAQYEGVKCSVLFPKDFRMKDEDGTDIWSREKFVARFKETYVDYDLWEKEDSKGCWNYGMCEFNGAGGIDMLEYEIDLKIMHINSREKK